MSLSRRRSDYRAYSSWTAMKNRCDNPKCSQYARYGGSGISYPREWEDFEAFLKDMGERPEGDYSIERVDNWGSYSKDNCIWADKTTQTRNRRCTVKINYQGQHRPLSEVLDELDRLVPGCDDKHNSLVIIQGRLRLGWTFEDASTTPVKRSQMITEDDIAKECQSFFKSHKRWPTEKSGQCKLGTWAQVNQALKVGGRGLAGGDSLSQLKKRLGFEAPDLTLAEIKASIRGHLQAFGSYPRHDTPEKSNLGGSTWASINLALRRGYRGLQGGSSLAKLKQQLKQELAI